GVRTGKSSGWRAGSVRDESAHPPPTEREPTSRVPTLASVSSRCQENESPHGSGWDNRRIVLTDPSRGEQGDPTPMTKPDARNGGPVPEFLRVVVADEKPASPRAVAEQAVLALNSSMLRLYDESLEKFKQNMRDR